MDIALLGCLLLVFRLYVVFFPLRDTIQDERWHLSRILVIYSGIALCTRLSPNIFTLIAVGVMPLMISIFILSDLPFFFHDVWREAKWQQHRFWGIFERLTLHLPIIGLGYYYYQTATRIAFLAMFTPFYILLGLSCTFGLFFLLDPRWRDRKEQKMGVIILLGAIINLTGFLWFASKLSPHVL